MRKLMTCNRQVEITEDKIPVIKPSYILVETMYSVISPGTELSIIYENNTEVKKSLGYSAMGEVMECGDDITDVKPGDLVACYGAPYVHHSEYLLVPKTLYSKVPGTVQPKEAALAGVGAIAIHALRTARLEFGETVVIVGLGLLGQMIAKIANAAALNVIAYDMQENRTKMMGKEKYIKTFLSLEEMEEELRKSTKQNGADAVLLCAGGKRSPLTHESLGWIRNKGKVVIVGDIEPDFPRDLMFEKEAELLISRAGGPGRYDQVYEAEAIDYPYGYVRWTEGRNIEEYIRLVNEKRIDVSPFISNEVDFEEAEEEFDRMLNGETTGLTSFIKFRD